MNTRDRILSAAFDLSRQIGLMGLTIGELAKTVGMSKSGLFGHFQSKTKLQKMVLDFAAEQFTLQVIKPAITEPKGLARLDRMIELWMEWSTSGSKGGCPFISSIVEFDDQPGEVREHLKAYQSQMLSSFEKAIQISIDVNQLDKDCSSQLAAFKLYGLMNSYHIYHRLLDKENAEKMFLISYQDLKRSYCKEEK